MKTKPEDQLSPPGGWRMVNNPRLTPIPRNDAGLATRIKLFMVEKIGKLQIANLMLMMRLNPRLQRGLTPFVTKLMPYGELERKDTELVILRVAWNCRARYEWGQHVDIGLRAGLTTDEIVRIGHGPEATGWSSKQATLIRACDEFHHERLVSDTTWQQLATCFNERLLLELLFLIGFYEGLAGVLNTAGLPLDAGVEKRLAALQASE